MKKKAVYVVLVRLGKSESRFLADFEGTLSRAMKDAVIFPTKKTAERELLWLENAYETDKVGASAHIIESDVDSLFGPGEDEMLVGLD